MNRGGRAVGIEVNAADGGCAAVAAKTGDRDVAGAGPNDDVVVNPHADPVYVAAAAVTGDRNVAVAGIDQQVVFQQNADLLVDVAQRGVADRHGAAAAQDRRRPGLHLAGARRAVVKTARRDVDRAARRHDPRAVQIDVRRIGVADPDARPGAGRIEKGRAEHKASEPPPG